MRAVTCWVEIVAGNASVQSFLVQTPSWCPAWARRSCISQYFLAALYCPLRYCRPVMCILWPILVQSLNVLVNTFRGVGRHVNQPKLRIKQIYFLIFPSSLHCFIKSTTIIRLQNLLFTLYVPSTLYLFQWITIFRFNNSPYLFLWLHVFIEIICFICFEYYITCMLNTQHSIF